MGTEFIEISRLQQQRGAKNPTHTQAPTENVRVEGLPDRVRERIEQFADSTVRNINRSIKGVENGE